MHNRQELGQDRTFQPGFYLLIEQKFKTQHYMHGIFLEQTVCFTTHNGEL